jgi:hypothetical protein
MKLFNRAFATDHLIVEKSDRSDPTVFSCYSKKDGKEFGIVVDALSAEESKKRYSACVKWLNFVRRLKAI